MTRSHNDHNDGDLLDLAVPYALHAMSDSERDRVESGLTDAGLSALDAFYDEVRAVRETMAVVSAGSAAEPSADLRERILAATETDNVRSLPTAAARTPGRRGGALIAAAAAVALGLGGLGVGLSLRPPAPQPSAAQPAPAEAIFTAPDVQTVSGAIPAGGRATVVFSRDRNAGVLVMNDVPPPAPGTVYQMWLVNDSGATLAGTMGAQDVAPSTKAVISDLGTSKKLAFTVEPAAGSATMSGPLIAELPLS